MDVQTFKATEEGNRRVYEAKYCHPDTARCRAGCPFWKPLHCHTGSPDYFCAYMLMTERRRGVDTGKCDIGVRTEEYDRLPVAVRLPYGRHRYPARPEEIPEVCDTV